MRSMIILLLLLVLFYGRLSADINQYYTFMSGTQPYVPINGTIVDIPASDCISSPVDIGFPFHYGENVYTQVKISCCGYISFNLTNGNQTVNNLAANYTDPLIAALWDYLFPTSTVMILLTGSAPNRIFTVQYSDVFWPASTSRSYDFQIRLQESGQVDLCYGPGQIDSVYGSASIGINMNPGGMGYFLSVRTAPTLLVSSTHSYDTVATYPGNGTVFLFVPGTLPVHDLRAESLTGASSLIQNEAGSFTINVNNHGLVNESGYSVRLKEGSTILATTTGPDIAANETIPVTLSWAAPEFGTHILYGEVVDADDEVQTNNQTDSLSVAVFPSSTIPVTLADATQICAMPYIVFDHSSIGETLYPASEINRYGTINAISFYNHFSRDAINLPTQIWIGTTPLTSLPNTWLPSTQLTLVYDGVIDYLAGDNIICIPLDNPYQYSEQNLVILVYKPGSDIGLPATNLFYGMSNEGVYSSLLAISSFDDINPTSPPVQDNVYWSMAKTTFHFTTGENISDEQTIPSTTLLKTYPNPFHTETTISLDIRKDQNTLVNVYNVKGQLIRTLVKDYKTKGRYSINWDGKDSSGNELAKGLYLLHANQANQARTIKILKL